MMIMIICIFQIAHKLSSIIIINIDLLVHSFIWSFLNYELFEKCLVIIVNVWGRWSMLYFSRNNKRNKKVSNKIRICRTSNATLPDYKCGSH